ncbi:MAG: hypothetical protein LBO00_09540 [Zoogloeaceae bacterium]|jgi:hypothetical protein|nr:hypothetical protein [Zoogloeaceae bacterium]
MTIDFDPPCLSREAALDTLTICREKLAHLEREVGRLSAQAALIGGYLEMAEATLQNAPHPSPLPAGERECFCGGHCHAP